MKESADGRWWLQVFLVGNFIQTGFGQFADLDHAYPPDRQM